MRTNWKKIALAIVLAILLGWLLYMAYQSKVDKPFKVVNLSVKNKIINEEFPAYYDTILSVGLDNINIMGITIELHQISESTKNKMDGFETKAHLRYYNDVYYLFADKWDRDQTLTILSHELIHIMQYHSGMLSYKDGIVFWQNSPNLVHYEQYDLKNTEYTNRPWEDDAFKKQNDMERSITDVLY